MGFTAKNDVTGDSIISKKTNKAYMDNWDKIDWSKKVDTVVKEEEKQPSSEEKVDD